MKKILINDAYKTATTFVFIRYALHTYTMDFEELYWN